MILFSSMRFFFFMVRDEIGHVQGGMGIDILYG
jgi:hypothetical protein